jgi:hypothetical protein
VIERPRNRKEESADGAHRASERQTARRDGARARLVRARLDVRYPSSEPRSGTGTVNAPKNRFRSPENLAHIFYDVRIFRGLLPCELRVPRFTVPSPISRPPSSRKPSGSGGDPIL